MHEYYDSVVNTYVRYYVLITRLLCFILNKIQSPQKPVQAKTTPTKTTWDVRIV